jgi:iron complex transport system substrate-binding protein
MRINLHHLALITALLCLPWTISVRAADQAGFPLEISHALGNTTIATRPNRVVTVAWANHEVPLALGIVPVGMAAANFGDDDGDGLLPWVAERLKELDAQAPQLFDEGDGIDFEAVAGTRPDVILAAYSGLSQSDYDTLSQIAPVVGYPQAPWSTDWREMIRFDSAGLGLAKEGEMLIADIERKIAMEVAKYPELRGKTAMFVTHLDASDLSIVNFYTTQDTRVRFFGDLGLSTPKSVVQASSTGSFAGSISAEQIDLFDDVDILVTYGDRGLIEAMKANPLLAHMPAVKHDAIVMLGRDPVGTAANPTPLSITWVLPAYVAMLAEAARKTE